MVQTTTLQSQSSVTGYKVINDPVHGYIKMDTRLFKIIDHPIFQRLRHLKQLGGLYFVFPGASHNRFEHSVGTSYLAGSWLRNLKQNSDENIQQLISEDDIFVVMVAGLCHDLGHGPFSHTFEDCFVKRQTDIEFEHEQASIDLLTLINKDTKSLTDDQLKKISFMIRGQFPEQEKYKFLYQIVSNHETEVDVDKIDYLARDCKSASLPLGFTFERLLEFSKIVEQNNEFKIAFDKREAYNLFQLFNTRLSLHKQIYSHRVVKSVELMIGDILFEAESVFNIKTILQEMKNPEKKDIALLKYSKLTDSLINEIHRREDEGLGEAKCLVDRLFKRQLYNNFLKVTSSKPLSDIDFSRLANLCDDSIIVKRHKIQFGNPQKVIFYDGKDVLDFIDTAELFGILEPRETTEESIRFFHKEENVDSKLIEALKEKITSCGLDSLKCSSSQKKVTSHSVFQNSDLQVPAFDMSKPPGTDVQGVGSSIMADEEDEEEMPHEQPPNKKKNNNIIFIKK